MVLYSYNFHILHCSNTQWGMLIFQTHFHFYVVEWGMMIFQTHFHVHVVGLEGIGLNKILFHCLIVSLSIYVPISSQSRGGFRLGGGTSPGPLKNLLEPYFCPDAKTSFKISSFRDLKCLLCVCATVKIQFDNTSTCK